MSMRKDISFTVEAELNEEIKAVVAGGSSLAEALPVIASVLGKACAYNKRVEGAEFVELEFED